MLFVEVTLKRRLNEGQKLLRFPVGNWEGRMDLGYDVLPAHCQRGLHIETWNHPVQALSQGAHMMNMKIAWPGREKSFGLVQYDCKVEGLAA